MGNKFFECCSIELQMPTVGCTIVVSNEEILLNLMWEQKPDPWLQLNFFLFPSVGPGGRISQLNFFQL